MFLTLTICPQVPEEGLNKMPYGKILRALRILEAALQRNEVPRVTIMAHLKVLYFNVAVTASLAKKVTVIMLF